MKTFTTILSFVILLLSTSCDNSKKQLEADQTILNEFKHLSTSTQTFLNTNAKVQCSCLEKHAGELETLMQANKDLVKQLEQEEVNRDDEAIESRISKEIHPKIGAYNTCLTDMPNPGKETMIKMQEDLKKFSGASAPGGESLSKMERLSNALLRKHCPALQQLDQQIKAFTKVIMPPTTEF